MQEQSWQTKIGSQEITLSTGKFAEQAHGSITATAGGTIVLATVVIAKTKRDEIDYFPLLVDYEERLYAAGKIKGSRWVKREGRPTDDAILTARLVDRSIRPLFPKDFYHDIQVIITVLSYDEKNNPDILSVLAASAALLQSGAPFNGPIAASRVAKIDGQLIVNPTVLNTGQFQLDLVVACTKDKVMMIEAEGDEIGEAEMLKAIKIAHQESQNAISVQEVIKGEPFQVLDIISKDSAAPSKQEIESLISQYAKSKIQSIFNQVADRPDRKKQLETLEQEVISQFSSNNDQKIIGKFFDKLVENVVRENILTNQTRPDGRQLDEIRPITAEVGLLPRTHGSGLFTRGQTQSLTIVTLGAPGEVQMIETMEEEGEKRFMHHYNFPPFSTAEAKPVRGASRREIGHGALAEKALVRMMPAREDFPYTIRLVSEILSSNGSSSMAATCASTLALMDAGVPIKKPVAGVAMGLITDPESANFQILTDIQGLEDFAGDMDFKIAGSAQGITAIQMDTKIAGLSMEIINQTLNQAQTARLKILQIIEKTIPEPRADISPYAPRITAIKIDPTKIGDVIGPGGKMINKIIEECGGKAVSSIDIDEDGTVMVSSTDSAMSKKAIQMIEGITKEVEIGEVYEGEVVQIIADRNTGKEIGAIVKILPNKEGMVHISEISPERIDRVSSVLKIGQIIKVKVLGIDKERGRIQLSIKAIKTHV